MKAVSVLLISSVFFISCSRHGIAEGRAYMRQSRAGAVRTTDNGKQMNSGVTKEYLIYIETDTSKPRVNWGTAWIEQKPYSVQPVEIHDPNQVIGKATDGTDALVRPKKGNRLWQLVLTPAQTNAGSPDLQSKINSTKILLTGTWKNKPFTYEISKEYELQPLDLQ